jgi:Icc-related predicted phosphoesterase
VKLLVFSDLHLEHKPEWQLPASFPDFDVLIAAGDISGSPAESIRLLAAHPPFVDKPIVFVAGNHEFYTHVLEDEIEKGRAAAAETGVHYLDGTAVVIDGVRFAGATLWTDFDLLGNRDLSMKQAEAGMNDYRYIKRRAYKAGQPGRWRILAKDTAWHHARQRAAIESILAEPFGGPTVVVTHHAPSRQSIPAFGTSLAESYASDLEDMLMQWKPELWVHGHIHETVDYVIGSTAIRSNPKGYGPHPTKRMWMIQNTNFDPNFVIDLPRQPQPKFCGGIIP